MSWMRFSHGLRRDPIAEGSAEALVAVFNEQSKSAQTLAPIVERWAATVPMTAFVAFDGIEQIELGLDTDGKPAKLDHAARQLEPLLKQQLRALSLDCSRLVLVGFGDGGTLVFNTVLRQGWGCAGVLAFSAKLVRPLPRLLRVGQKIRLIECVGEASLPYGSLPETVALLMARGIDARGALLTDSMLSDAAIRHGGAYLVELVATAQRGDRFNIDQERSHAS